MRLLTVTALPIYLPADIAAVPFGDPLVGTVTIASPGVFTVPGYDNPAIGDAIQLSTTGALPTGLAAGVTYYLVATVTSDTFSVSATKGGAAINTSVSQSGVMTVHMVSQQNYGPKIPFKPGNSVLVVNLSGGQLVLQGAPDTNTTTYGAPAGPGTPVTIATVPANSIVAAVLNYDWIFVSTAATLALLQN